MKHHPAPWCFALLSLLSPCAAQERPTSHPNIVVLYADDLGYGDLRCYNPDSKIPTPHLDRLASEGMRFTDGHSSSGICSPSRYALLTGRYHWRKFHRVVSSFGDSVFDASELTLPEMLRDSGYTTAAIGKWHLGWDWKSIRKADAKPREKAQEQPIWGPEAFDWSKPIAGGPLAHGFDSYYGDDVINFPPYTWIENDRVLEAPDRMMDTALFRQQKEGSWEARPGPMVTGWDPYQNVPVTTEKAVGKIHELAKTGKPFFLYFSFPSPHAPIIPNDKFDGQSGAGPYGDYVVETDEACGRLLKALDEAGVADNTLVVFTADNGAEWYAYPREEKTGHWSSHPFRGAKRDLYEGGHHVPFIVRWTGSIPAGKVNEALVSQIDLMATCAAILGVKLPRDQAGDSQNLLPVLLGKTSTGRDTLVHNTLKDQYAIRHGDWVLIDGETGTMNKPEKVSAWEKKRAYPTDNLPVELYNLRDDVEQRHNLAEKHPEKVRDLQTRLKQIRGDGASNSRNQE